jgi:gluconokinase
MPHYLGLDLGTTSAKVCAFDAGGRLIAERRGDYELYHPEPGAAVQHVMEIVAVAERILRELIAELPETPVGLGISCPMHGLLLLDGSGEPTGPILTWADVRPQAVMSRFPPHLRPRLLKKSGTPVHPMSPLVKLRWLNEFHPERLGKATHLSDLKSFLVDRWTTAGRLIDEQLASATGLLSLTTRDWDEELLAFAGNGTPPKLDLPRVVPADTRLEWRPEVAERLGTREIRLYIGGSDGCLANLGSGILEPGKVALTVGTSGAVRTTHRGMTFRENHQLFNYLMHGEYRVLGGATNNGGKAIEWAYELLQSHFDDIGSMIDTALARPVTDLKFSPYLYGERAPIWDAMATASLSGLRGHHGPADVARAVIEGVTENVVAILRQVEAATCPAEVIYASGGFTRTAAWVQLVEERAGRPVEVAATPQASAYGAARVAQLAEEEGQGRKE